MDEKKLDPATAALQRARLHIRGGRRRMRQGKTAAGIATLYDALSHSMQWFWLTRQNSVQDHVPVMPGDRELFSLLVAEGALDLSMDFEKIFNLMKKSLDNSLPMHDYDDIVRNMETIMTRLGVLPFDENALPPEDPRTY
jgi:hypothetical protein